MKPLLKSDDARRLQAVMSRAPIGSALIAPGGRFLNANQALIDLLGAPNEQAILDQSVYDSGSYNQEIVRNMVGQVDSHEPEVNVDAQWISTWGKPVNARMFITQLADSDGETVYQVFYEDLLDRVDNTQTWNSMLDASSNEFYVIHQTRLTYLYASDRSMSQTGYTMAELTAMTPTDLCPEMSLQEVRTTVLPRLETTPSWSFEATVNRKDGSSYPIQGSIQKTTFNGDPAYLLIIQDVTKTIATDSALAQARLFLNSAPDPTVILNDDGTIVFASERTEALFGFSRTELIGMGMNIIWPTIDNPHEGAVQPFQHRDGSSIPVETSFCHIQTSDEVLTAISCRDVTKRLATEKALKQAKEQAEHATQTKSHLLAAASHDLRQPTQSLSQYCWLLQQEATTPAISELARNIQSSADSIADLLNTLLDISKLESEMIKPEVTCFDIASLRDTILANYGPAAQAKGIALSCSSNSCLVRSDPALVLRILENLVANAIRYTHFGGVKISWNKTADGLTVTVSDSGIGIAVEQIEKIFDEHYQIESAKSAQSKGLGLGLSIVQRVSKLLELPVTVNSALGQGSCFSITIPIANSVTHSDRGVSDGARDFQAATAKEVLLIDDELAVLKSTKMVLERNHCTVHAATTGESAIQQLQAGIRPDILVTDYRLPGLSGTELIELARKTLGADIPAVIVTGDMSGAAINIEHLSPIELLHKPTSIKTLVSTIAKMTD